MEEVPKKKTPWVLILGGCGCLTVLFLLCGGALAYFGFQKAGDFAEESGFSDFFDAVKPADEGGNSAKSSSKSSKKSTNSSKTGKNAKKSDDPQKSKEDAIKPAAVKAYTKKALTKKDISDHYAFQAKWKKNPEHQEWVKQLNAAKKLGDDQKSGKSKESVANQLKTMSTGLKAAKSLQNMIVAYDAFIMQEGGYEKYYGRLVRIGGVVAASEAMVQAHKSLKDPDADAVAKKMIEERPEVAREYEKSLEEAKDGDEASMMAINTMFYHPGIAALARMPASSFKVWSNLSVKERKKLRDSIKPKEDELDWFMMYHVNAASLISVSLFEDAREAAEENKKKK